MQSDPEAAKIVFECGAAVTMIPLEVTHTALATPGVLQHLTARPTPFLQLMHKVLLFFAQTYRDVFSFEHPPLHDPLAVFYVACPEAFKVRPGWKVTGSSFIATQQDRISAILQSGCSLSVCRLVALLSCI